jgi:hypothetical protein
MVKRKITKGPDLHGGCGVLPLPATLWHWPLPSEEKLKPKPFPGVLLFFDFFNK